LLHLGTSWASGQLNIQAPPVSTHRPVNLSAYLSECSLQPLSHQDLLYEPGVGIRDDDALVQVRLGGQVLEQLQAKVACHHCCESCLDNESQSIRHLAILSQLLQGSSQGVPLKASVGLVEIPRYKLTVPSRSSRNQDCLCLHCHPMLTDLRHAGCERDVSQYPPYVTLPHSLTVHVVKHTLHEGCTAKEARAGQYTEGNTGSQDINSKCRCKGISWGATTGDAMHHLQGATTGCTSMSGTE
jgi:hypothetical protein